MRYESQRVVCEVGSASCPRLYRKKLSWKDIRSFLDTMYVYARWAFSTCDALLDDFVRMMSQLLRTSASVANDPFMSAPDKPARLRALGQEILQKWALALWKGALKNANHRVPEHRSGSFRQSLLESKIRAERVKDWPEPVHETWLILLRWGWAVRHRRRGVIVNLYIKFTSVWTKNGDKGVRHERGWKNWPSAVGAKKPLQTRCT